LLLLRPSGALAKEGFGRTRSSFAIESFGRTRYNNHMIINDKIYGKVKIEEPVLLKLLKSPSVLRLKNISQFGVPDLYYHFKNYSRYEHSVGVMILLRKLGATLEEQVAGLLHDVSVLTLDRKSTRLNSSHTT
jgi:hypothetical protein